LHFDVFSLEKIIAFSQLTMKQNNILKMQGILFLPSSQMSSFQGVAKDIRFLAGPDTTALVQMFIFFPVVRFFPRKGKIIN